MAVTLAAALFPKCPVCWATYLSFLGIAGAGAIPFAPWLRIVLHAAIVANVASLWWRGRSTGFMLPFHLGSAGALLIFTSVLYPSFAVARTAGIVLTAAASILNASGLLAHQALRRTSSTNASP
jgi:protein SCO1/2